MSNGLSIHFSALVKVDICLSLSVAFDDNKEHIIVEHSLPNLSHIGIILGSVLEHTFLGLI